MNRRFLGAAVCFALVSASAMKARAFSDPSQFDMEAKAGGGGGRFFTGSPRDGYACSVCHLGGEPPKIEIRGLPAVFAPDRLYEVELRWDGEVASHALQLELVTKNGVHPSVEIEPEQVLRAEGRCDGDPEGEAASYGIDSGGRRVVGVRDCGASRVSIQFRAPDEPELYFAASIVRSDSSGTARGDGVTDVRRVLLRAGEKAEAGCGIAGGANSRRLDLWLAALALFAQRKSRASSKVASRASTRESPTKAK